MKTKLYNRTLYRRPDSKAYASNSGSDSSGLNLPDLASMLLDIPSSAMRTVMEGVGKAGLPRPAIANARACKKPACHCRTRDLGEISKETDRLEVVQMSFRFRNSGKTQRAYSFTAQPAVSATGQAGGAITVSPTTVNLQPGEYATIRVEVDARAHDIGSYYTSTVFVTPNGAATLCLKVGVMVRSEPEFAPIIDVPYICRPQTRDVKPHIATAAVAGASAIAGQTNAL